MNTLAVYHWSSAVVFALAVSRGRNAFAADVPPPFLTVATPSGQVVTNATILVEGTATDDLALQRIRVFTGTAGTGYTFVANLPLSGRSAAWSGDATGTNNPLTVIMTTKKSITANFSQTIPCPSPPMAWRWPPRSSPADVDSHFHTEDDRYPWPQGWVRIYTSGVLAAQKSALVPL